jgi:hypothetical protein
MNEAIASYYQTLVLSVIGDKHSGSQDWQQFPRAADVRLITCAVLSACVRPYEFRCLKEGSDVVHTAIEFKQNSGNRQNWLDQP